MIESGINLKQLLEVYPDLEESFLADVLQKLSTAEVVDVDEKAVQPGERVVARLTASEKILWSIRVTCQRSDDKQERILGQTKFDAASALLADQFRDRMRREGISPDKGRVWFIREGGRVVEGEFPLLNDSPETREGIRDGGAVSFYGTMDVVIIP